MCLLLEGGREGSKSIRVRNGDGERWREGLPQIKSIRGPGCWAFPCFRNSGRCSPGALPKDDSVQGRETLGSQTRCFLFPLGFSPGVHTILLHQVGCGIGWDRTGGKCDLAGIPHPEPSVINTACYFLCCTQWNCYCSSVGRGCPPPTPSCVFPVTSLPEFLSLLSFKGWGQSLVFKSTEQRPPCWTLKLQKESSQARWYTGIHQKFQHLWGLRVKVQGKVTQYWSIFKESLSWNIAEYTVFWYFSPH